MIVFLIVLPALPDCVGPALVSGGRPGAADLHDGPRARSLAALTVHFRDIRDILANVLMLWFFSTPIIYPWFQTEVRPYKRFFDLNPFTHLAISYQEILFFHGPIGHWRWLLALGVGVSRRVPRRLLAVRSAARFVCGGV